MFCHAQMVVMSSESSFLDLLNYLITLTYMYYALSTLNWEILFLKYSCSHIKLGKLISQSILYQRQIYTCTLWTVIWHCVSPLPEMVRRGPVLKFWTDMMRQPPEQTCRDTHFTGPTVAANKNFTFCLRRTIVQQCERSQENAIFTCVPFLHLAL